MSNGKLIEKRSNADKTVTFHWRQDKPHVSYLVTLVVGRFDVVREEWQGLPVGVRGAISPSVMYDGLLRSTRYGYEQEILKSK